MEWILIKERQSFYKRKDHKVGYTPVFSVWSWTLLILIVISLVTLLGAVVWSVLLVVWISVLIVTELVALILVLVWILIGILVWVLIASLIERLVSILIVLLLSVVVLLLWHSGVNRIISHHDPLEKGKEFWLANLSVTVHVACS